MTPEERPTYRLLLNSVDATDAAKLVAFMRIGAPRLAASWEVVEDGRADAYIVGSDEAETMPADFEHTSVLLRIVDRDKWAEEPTSLVRPMQYDDFIEAMQTVERMLSKAREDGVRPTSPSEASIRTTSAPVAAMPAASAPVPAPAGPTLPPPVAVSPVSPATPIATLAGPPGELPAGALFRLRCWPPAALIGQQQHHLRLASFMSTRHLGLDELARLSNIDRARCETFVAALAQAGLLTVTTGIPDDAPKALPAITAPPQPENAGRGSLFSRIRRTLGMAWAR